MGPKRKTATARNKSSPSETTSPDAISATSSHATADPVSRISVVLPQDDAPVARSLPGPLKFLLVLIISFSLSASTKTLYYVFNGPRLELISRDGASDWQLAGTTAWKILELGLIWYFGFDSSDTLALTLLSHLPHYFLLQQYYLLPLLPSIVLLVTTILSTILPIHLLRRRSPSHLNSSLAAPAVTISTDPITSISATLFSTTLYILPLVLSTTTWLPLQLATHFSGIATLGPAHEDFNLQMPKYILFLFIPLGFSATKFIFQPATSPYPPSAESGNDDIAVSYTLSVKDFDPIAASLSQTLHRNLLWYLYLPLRAQEVLKRCVIATVWTVMNSFFWAWIEIEGTDLIGAGVWSGVWGVGCSLSCLGLGWVGEVLG